MSDFRAFIGKSMSNFSKPWVEVLKIGPIVDLPRHSAVPASWNNATFLTIVSG
jgi:hypothetical protein